MGFWKKLITGETQPRIKQPIFRKLTHRDLIRMESKIGSQLFGVIPGGHRREFFCLDRHTWIWYEQWVDEETGKSKEMTTRYEVHPNGVLKVQDGQPYAVVEGEELHNLFIATKLYHQRVMKHVYHRDPQTGHRLAA